MMSDQVETDSAECGDSAECELFISISELIFDDNENLAEVSTEQYANRNPGSQTTMPRTTSTTCTPSGSSTTALPGTGRPRPTSMYRSSVSRARRGSTLVAVKNVHQFKEEEIKTLVSLSHENVIRYIGAVKSNFTHAIIMEFQAGGNLYEHLAKNREERTPLPLWQCLNWAVQCARGLKYLHDNGIIHKNIQSYNYLLSSVDVTNCILKLSNFGLTKPEHTSYSIITTWHGSSMAWRAPEVISDPTFCKKYSDVFSLGVVIWELLTCNTPWGELTDRDISNTVRSGKHLPIPEDCPENLNKLLENCWLTERASRPKMFNICASLECFYREENHQYDLKPNFPEMTLRMDMMAEIASRLKHKSKWRDFAVNHLRITDDVCDDLEKEEPYCERVRAVLCKWLMREGQKGTVGRLANHLKDFRQFDPLGYKFLCELSPLS